ncbi:MAG: DNA polymerase IV [Tepidisphaeraceae bacterium]
MNAERTILHVDMDAFFAAVEQRDDPSLRGKPVLVGGGLKRGVVSTASYEARVFGCRSAMPMAQALRLCPHAIVVRGGYHKYSAASKQMFAILERFTPDVQPVSVDEAFLDVTGSLRALKCDGVEVAQRIRLAIDEELQLTASVGVAPNKFLAKLASDLNKPDGLTVITPGNLDATLCPLPVGRIWGIGPKTAKKLEGLNLKTIGDLRRMNEAWFGRFFGEWGERVRNLIFGRDERPVVCDHDAKSIGHEQTFGDDLTDIDAMRDVLLQQVEHVAERVRRQQLLAGVVQVKLRSPDFHTLTRRATLRSPTDVTEELWHAARDVFDHWAREKLCPLRLLGFSASGLTTSRQMDLFGQVRHEKQRKLDGALDAINRRFGKQTVHRGRATNDEE